MPVASVSTDRHYRAVHWILQIFSKWQILADGGYTTWYMEFLHRIKILRYAESGYSSQNIVDSYIHGILHSDMLRLQM
jgi:hypothetical protein